MLGGRDDMLRPPVEEVALQAPYRGYAQSRDQIGIFSIGFLGAPPARVAGQVQHRRKDIVCASGPHLFCHNFEHPPVQVGIPGTGQPDRLREAGRFVGHVTVQAFPDPQRRDAQARFFAQEFLHGVQIGDGLTRLAAAVMGVDVGDPIHEMLAGEVERKRPIAFLQPKRADQLRTFFAQRHPGDQVLDPCFDG